MEDEFITWQEAKKMLASSKNIEEARRAIGAMSKIPKTLEQEIEYGNILAEYSRQGLKRFPE